MKLTCAHRYLALLTISSVLVMSQVVLDPPPLTPSRKNRSYIYSVTRASSTNASSWSGRARRAATPAASSQSKPSSHNVSHLLDSLFIHYNKTFRPGYGYGPTQVHINMVVLSLGPIRELNSDYSMDLYFRQKWRDERLQFTGSKEMKEIALNNLMLDMIWKPDTYFHNGKEYYVHTITTANKLLRVYPNGDILYSMRLTIRARCPMRLTFYPADRQSCPLIIGSFAYQSHDLLYNWDQHAVKLDGLLTLSQFELQGFPSRSFFAEFERGMKKENYSMVRVDFQLQRRMGYFLLQIYLPCMLIVVLSWVSFWLNRESTERLTLGITVLLTLATMNQDQKDILPKTSFPTALEWYILICNLYVSASIIQFAAVHFFTKTGFEELNYVQDTPVAKPAADDDWVDEPSSDKTQPDNNPFGNNSAVYKNNHSSLPVVPTQWYNESSCHKFLYCITGNEGYRSELIRRGKVRKSPVNSVSFLDRVSRIGFPLSFGLVNLCYWTSFMYGEPDLVGHLSNLTKNT